MASRRTQIYLTEEQRERLDEIVRRDDKSLAEVIREAIDAFIGKREFDEEEWIRQTAGSAPDFHIPSRKELWGKRGSAPPGHERVR